jgi:hypothetical protein
MRIGAIVTSLFEACREDLTVTPKYIESTPVYVAEINGQIVGFYVCAKSKAELRDLFGGSHI